MSWFFFLLPMIILFLAAAIFNKWPVESLWVLAVMMIGPVWMLVKEMFPKVMQNINAKYNMINYLQKNLKNKDLEIKKLKLEAIELNQELAGLYKIWKESKSNIEFKYSPVAEVAKSEEQSNEKLIEIPYEASNKIFAQHKMKNYSIIEDEANDVIEMSESNISG